MRKLGSGGISVVLFLVVAVVTTAYLCYPLLTPSSANGTGALPGGKDIVVSSNSLPEAGWIYEQLNEQARMTYDVLVAGVANGSLSFVFDEVDYETFEEDLSDAVAALTYEHPEFFWISGGYRYVRSHTIGRARGDFEVDLMCYDYWTYTADPQGYIDTLEAKVDEIAAQARQYETDYERVLFVHDYIVSRVDYNHEAAEETKNTIRKASSEQAYSAYGCLVDDNAICGGYSKGFQLLMTELGIECLYVKGIAGGGYHGWNCVRIGGEYYFFDLTWDDPGLTKEDGTLRYPQGITYAYFGVTTERMARTHSPLPDFLYPLCVAEVYNYHEFNGLSLDAYSFEAFQAVIHKQSNQNILSVSFANEAELRYAEQEILKNKRYREIEVLNGGFSYSVDRENRMIQFYL